MKEKIHKCNKEHEIAEILKLTYGQEEKINAMYKALMGNGQKGLFAEFQQAKGMLTILKVIASSGLITGLIATGLHFLG